MIFLLVDDVEGSLQRLQQIITGLGHSVGGVARDGLEAVNQYRKVRPDVVVLDVIMPRMNGMEALRAIRRFDPRARVVMASSMRSPETALASEREGARFFLYKPIEEAHLRSVIAKLEAEMGQAYP